MRGVDEWRHGGDDSFSGPLHRRGWVVQERLLSTRTIHYGSKEIFWECLTMDKSEAWPEGILWEWNNNRLYRRPKELFRSILELGAGTKSLLLQADANQDRDQVVIPNLQETEEPSKWKNPSYLFQQTYSNLVHMYTSCTLTFPSDKLPAFSGVIEALQKSSNLTPVAGLWKELLLPNLLWYSVTPKPRPKFPDKHKPPSWSWASVDGSIRFMYPRLYSGDEQNVLGFTFWLAFELEWKVKVHEVMLLPVYI